MNVKLLLVTLLIINMSCQHKATKSNSLDNAKTVAVMGKTNPVIPYKNGRIIISSDGNEHDHDDWAATPFSLAMLAARGLQDSLVVYTFSDHIWGSNNLHEGADEQMRISALGGKEQFGFDKSNFIEAVADSAAAVDAIVSEINKSNKDNPLIIIGAGPMHVIGCALDASDKTKFKFIRLISHSGWNNRHSDDRRPDKWPWDDHTGWTWNEMKESFSQYGILFDYIKDQNGTNSGDVDAIDDGQYYEGMRAPIEQFAWLKTSEMRNDNAYKPGSWDWLYERQETCIKKGEFDPSYAGMMIYFLTGKQKTSPDDAREIMENPVER